jgi:hypothetical protein
MVPSNPAFETLDPKDQELIDCIVKIWGPIAPQTTIIITHERGSHPFKNEAASLTELKRNGITVQECYL